MLSQAEIAYAKINLALHVRGRIEGGYHALETVFAFADDGDRLSAREAERLSLEVTGPFGAVLAGEGDDNLVLRAARAVADAFAPRRSAALSLGTGPARSRIFSEVASGTFSTPVARGSTNNSIQSLRITSSLWGPGTAWRYGESRCG